MTDNKIKRRSTTDILYITHNNEKPFKDSINI